jgi:hypothetical protein
MGEKPLTRRRGSELDEFLRSVMTDRVDYAELSPIERLWCRAYQEVINKPREALGQLLRPACWPDFLLLVAYEILSTILHVNRRYRIESDRLVISAGKSFSTIKFSDISALNVIEWPPQAKTSAFIITFRGGHIYKILHPKNLERFSQGFTATLDRYKLVEGRRYLK